MNTNEGYVSDSSTNFGKKSDIVRWIMCVVYLISVIVFAGKPGYGTGIVATCGLLFCLLHGPKRYGMKTTLIFLVMAYAISTFMEDMSIRFGFPFGNYHYNADYLISDDFTQGMLPYIDQVPFQVGIMYIAMVYFSWTIACIILDHADRRLDSNLNLVALPAVGAFIMCQFDLVQDPVTSTYDGIWIWENGGGVFGVPLVNFLGWYLTAFIIMFCFALYLRHCPQAMRNTKEQERKGFWVQPVILYFLIGFSYICQYVYQYLNNASAVVTDLGGTTWSVLSMHENSVTVMVFTMLYTCLLAVIHILQMKAPKEKSSDITEEDSVEC